MSPLINILVQAVGLVQTFGSSYFGSSSSFIFEQSKGKLILPFAKRLFNIGMAFNC